MASKASLKELQNNIKGNRSQSIYFIERIKTAEKEIENQNLKQCIRDDI